ncbi:DUF1311 domain-containing protein [Hydrogenophaga sp. PAMC20947]|uniref:DUF1311 domain-containing protein n=1 Tax=Hydrogenophaga sp. PAMC20947 TaxID=2565558 RepID=UPI00109DBD75|nr:DUF1311 domain-containing protein [Hydrogenophaga sp. PAMC20947]QCB45511.1 hypothetical protein E5678_05415 [Hydrogenophaga sp. PAMC20947]
MTQQVGADGPPLHFDFELGDEPGPDENVLGAGFIVVRREGREIQALPHAFEMPKEAIDRNHWLSFKDFNGDGQLDFVVTRMLTGDTGQAITSLYQMDAKTGKYFQVVPLSNVGAISAALPGCVNLKSRDERGAARHQVYCYAKQASKWIHQSGLGRQEVPDLAEAGCAGSAAGLIDCRKSRIELDRQLLSLLRELRNGRRDSLLQEVNRGYASAYAKHMDRGHRTWLLYRDARCTTQVREQAVPVGELGAATESCRFEMAREQLTSYQKRLVDLAAGPSQ